MSAFDALDADTRQEIEAALDAGHSASALASDLHGRGLATDRSHQALKKAIQRHRRDVVQPRQVQRMRTAAARSPRHVGSRASTLDRLRALSDQSESEAWMTADARDRGDATNKDARAALDHAQQSLLALHRVERELGVVDAPRRPKTHAATLDATGNDVTDATDQEAAVCADMGLHTPSAPIPDAPALPDTDALDAAIADAADALDDPDATDAPDAACRTVIRHDHV
jgi:hypothetical protein